jgi:hypothetical protein
MKIKKIATGCILLSFMLIFALFPAYADAETRYLKNNIHFQERPGRGGKIECKASYANWTNPGAGHMVIPVNTPIRTGRWRGGFYFVGWVEERNPTIDLVPPIECR